MSVTHALVVAVFAVPLVVSEAWTAPFSPKQVPKKIQGEPCALSARSVNGAGGFKSVELCITRDGNVKVYGVKGSAKFIQDAYWICYPGAFGRAYAAVDPGAGPGTGFVGEPVVEQPNGAGTFPLIITRTTAGPVFSLRQQFDQETGDSLDLKVEITLQYLGPDAQQPGVKLFRQVDRERPYVNPKRDQLKFETKVEALQSGFVSAATDSVFGWNKGIEYGLVLTTPEFGLDNVTHQVGANSPGLELFCPSNLAPLLGPGDVRGRVVFDMGTMETPCEGVCHPTSKRAELRFWLF